MQGRTTRNFVYNDELWPVVEAWAVEHGFTLELQVDSHRKYVKKGLFMMAPAYLEVHQQGTDVTLEAWIKADLYMVMTLLRGESAEAGIQSGGLTAWIPRMRARGAINLLLSTLGQSPIT